MIPFVVVATALAAGMACGEPTGEAVASFSRQYAEFTGVVNNPGQGWTTTVGSYGKLKDFLNIGAIYERFEWRNLESEEERYDWSRMERICGFAAAHGIPANTRIMCANSGNTGGGSCPLWLWQKTARHHEWECFSYSNQIITNRSPYFEDVDFIALHGRFLKAFAAKYDGDPRFGGIDLGSYGNWGEWHCGKLPPSVPDRLPPELKDGKHGYFDQKPDYRKTERLGIPDMKKYVDLYLDNFRKTDVVFMTDGWEALDYAIGAGEGSRVGLRRDGVGNSGHFNRWYDQPKSHYAKIAKMSEVWKWKPVWFEAYGTYRSLAENSVNAKNTEYMFYWMLTNHVSLFNSFPYNVEKERDNPQVRKMVELVNLYAGARLVPRSASVARRGDSVAFELKGENKGVAKIYLDYALTLIVKDTGGKTLAEVDCRADPRTWLPGAFEVRETVKLPADTPANAAFALRLRHRPRVLKDFRFAVKDLDDGGMLPL